MKKVIQDGHEHDRRVLNDEIRKTAYNIYNQDYRFAWNVLFTALKEKHGIDIKSREGRGSHISKIADNEWSAVHKEASCISNHSSVYRSHPVLTTDIRTPVAKEVVKYGKISVSGLGGASSLHTHGDECNNGGIVL